jgi:CubicO group peptidase (beta-lactamase class C family)
MIKKMNSYFLVLIPFVLSFLFCQKCFAQYAVELIKVQEQPVIDGFLNEKIWKNASIFSDFRTMDPEPGLPPSEKTKVYITYSQTYIYVGFECYDSEPDKIVTGTAGKDNPANDDWIAFCLDTFNDHLGAYFFLVTPLGVQTDGKLNADGSPGLTFNTQWSAAGKITDFGYTAEIAIPFKNLPYSWEKELTMGLKVARLISRKSEEIDYPEIMPDRAPHISQFRKIKISDIVKNSVSDLDNVVNVHERYLQKKSLSQEYDVNTLDGRCQAWGDASVIDYKIFPKHELQPSNTPFHFHKNYKENLVKSIFEPMEYLNEKKIGNLERFLNRTQTAGFLIIKDDTIIYEKYFNGYQRDSICTSFSVAKSFASTLIGIAIDEGLIESVLDPITKYLPELEERDKRFSDIRIKDLLSMSSGIRYIEDRPPYRDDEITYYDSNLRRAALTKTEIVDPPGKHFLYNNYNPLLIGMILERATGKTVTEYLQENLWGEIGAEFPGSWSTDSKKNGFEKMESGINARAIDFAKFGRLILNDGRWNNRQIVSPKWIKESTQPDTKSSKYYSDWRFFKSEGGYYKYFWWGRKRVGGKSDFFGLGNKGQYIYICPKKNLIIVRNGIEYGIPSMQWVDLFFKFATRL